MTVSADNFGLLIAYLLPGFVCLWATSPFVGVVRLWLQGPAETAPSVGGFLYVTVASVAAGLVASTVRWMVIDRLHHRTGLPEPHLDFSRLADNFAAFEGLVQNHYRYYQANANMLVAVCFAYGADLVAYGHWPGRGIWPDVDFLLVSGVLFLGSRDTLRRYYARTSALLGTVQPQAAPEQHSTPPTSCPEPLPRQVAATDTPSIPYPPPGEPNGVSAPA